MTNTITDAERALAAELWSNPTMPGIEAALASAKAEGYRRGQEEMRKAAANWLRRQANAEKESKARAAFIEAHNAIRALPITGADK